MKRLVSIVAASALAAAMAMSNPLPAGAATGTQTDPTGDIGSAANSTYDITQVAATLTSSTVSTSVTFAGTMPALTDTTWSTAGGAGRIVSVFLGKEFGNASFLVDRDGSFALDVNGDPLLSCTVTGTLATSTRLDISAPRSCFGNPGRIDVFAATFNTALTDGYVDLAADGGTGVVRDDHAATSKFDDKGYYLGAEDLGVFSFGGVAGVAGQSVNLNEPVVGFDAQPNVGNKKGVRMVATDGGVFCFRPASSTADANGFYGSMGGHALNEPMIAIANTPTGNGYWTVATDGGVFSFGDAGYYGSMGGRTLNAPIIGIAATPSGHGYWLVATDGGIFSFGDAAFYGSTGSIDLNAPIVGISPTSTGHGYSLVASDGGVFNYGDARYFGSAVGENVDNIVGIDRTSDNGYVMVSADGKVYSFGVSYNYGDINGVNIYNEADLNAAVVGISVPKTPSS